MNVNLFCKLTCTRFVCKTHTSVVTDALGGIKFYLFLKHTTMVVQIKHDGVVLKHAEYPARGDMCDVVFAAIAARRVVILASGIVRLFLHTSTGLRSPKESMTVNAAARAVAAYSGCVVAMMATNTGTALLSNGVHIMFYPNVVYLKHKGRTRSISTRGGAWQPIVGAPTRLVNCGHAGSVIADMCHTAFAMAH